MKPSEVLDKAADLVEPKGAWIQRDAFRLPNGLAGYYGPGAFVPQDATACCIVGAISLAVGAHVEPVFTARRYVGRALGIDWRKELTDWNDAARRRQPEVVTALRQAAALARREGQ